LLDFLFLFPAHSLSTTSAPLRLGPWPTAGRYRVPLFLDAPAGRYGDLRRAYVSRPFVPPLLAVSLSIPLLPLLFIPAVAAAAATAAAAAAAATDGLCAF